MHSVKLDCLVYVDIRVKERVISAGRLGGTCLFYLSLYFCKSARFQSVNHSNCILIAVRLDIECPVPQPQNLSPSFSTRPQRVFPRLSSSRLINFTYPALSHTPIHHFLPFCNCIIIFFFSKVFLDLLLPYSCSFLGKERNTRVFCKRAPKKALHVAPQQNATNQNNFHSELPQEKQLRYKQWVRT